MHARPFEQFLKQVSALTRRQRERLLDVLVPAAKLDKAVDLIEQAAAGRLACPHCQSRHFHRHGRAHGLQRYRCKDCGRTCNALSGTALARLRHKERWLDYAFARDTGITHETINLQAGIRVRGAIHVQNVNAYHGRLRGWLLPFRGVASRYLPNYLGWRWALDGGRVGSAEGLLRASLGARQQAIFHT
jgi:transposase-like protein